MHKDAHKTQVRQAVEELFDVNVERVNIVKVQAKPKRRGMIKGTRPGWKKAIVQLREGQTIEYLRRSAGLDGRPPLQADEPGPPLHDGLDFEEVTKSKPEKALTEKLTKKGGRNNNGRITTRHQGGGHKRRYRVIDFKRRKDGVPAKVAAIEYDPNRSARIALLHYADGAKAYILAPGAAARSARSSSRAPARTSSPATRCRSRTSRPARSSTTSSSSRARAARWRAARARASSSSPRTTATRSLRLPSGEMRRVPLTCRATVGQVGNVDHENITGGKAGRSRWQGKRPAVRGSAMNPVDHPHGGGEGKSKGGRHPVTPWGVPTLGKRTRRKHKESDKLIVRGRRRGKDEALSRVARRRGRSWRSGCSAGSRR